MTTKYYSDFCGASASITVHKDGTATLKWHAGMSKGKSEHKSEKAAKAAWYRKCN